jgi:hypothetical protein
MVRNLPRGSLLLRETYNDKDGPWQRSPVHPDLDDGGNWPALPVVEDRQISRHDTGVRRSCARVTESLMSKRVLQNFIVYSLAAVIVGYAARSVSWTQVADASSQATLWLFVAASLGGFLCWFFGEDILFSRLFSYFHGPTRARELLPTMAAFCFFQIVNSYVASSAYVLFLHTRKRVPWLTGGCTLLFQGYVDVMLLSALSLLAAALVPTSAIGLGRYYAAGVLGAGCVIASFWLMWGAHLRDGNWLRWLYERPSMTTFRMARPSHFIKLLSIRLLIVVGTGFALYGQLVSFHIRVPLVQALAMTPLIVAIGNSPFTPGGIGTTQLLFTIAFARFAGKSDLFALSLAVSAFNLLVRAPMGLAMGAPLAEEAVEVTRELRTRRLSSEAHDAAILAD